VAAAQEEVAELPVVAGEAGVEAAARARAEVEAVEEPVVEEPVAEEALAEEAVAEAPTRRRQRSSRRRLRAQSRR
jgi:hypothetical protein